jgi:hypothetical protein
MIDMEWLSYAKLLLDYDPETGFFRWKKPGRKRKVGAIAGGIRGGGYWSISINHSVRYAHRAAFAWVHGRWPDGQIDHINGNRCDNRISNLREASNQQNQANARRRKDNTSGFKGVRPAKIKGKWWAYVYVNGKATYIGTYDSPELAHQGYVKAASVAFGEFAKPE